MPKKYPNLLSPLKVGNTTFRNRLFTAPLGLHALQGGEPYPTQAIMDTFANKAKGGAAMVTLTGVHPVPVVSDGEHIAWDIYTAHTRHYLAHLADAVHFYGAKASMEIYGTASDPKYTFFPEQTAYQGDQVIDMPEDIMDEIAENYAFQAYMLQDLGYDMVMLHFAYRLSVGGKFLSPATNKRTDKYGGSVENRARFPIMIFDRIKEKCGKDFLIELRMSGMEPVQDGITMENSIELARLLEGHIDLLHVHAGTMGDAHPLSFLPPTPYMGLAGEIKKSGTKLHIVTIGGYQDLDVSEETIASGNADFISMGRGWIADPNIGVKAYEGRNEDIVPCIKCMRCHDSACLENRQYVCSVNPTIGLEHRMEKIVKPPKSKKKVAVVGGGPAGMQAALTAADRGHDVTLYEKSDVLGGHLVFSDYVSFKKPLNKFKQFLILQLKKTNVRICMNTEADSQLLGQENYDVVISALGAEPLLPSIPGIDSKNVITALDVYGNEDSLGSKIVVIGAGQVGCETALHLAMTGRDVTIIEMQDGLAPDASISYRDGLIHEMETNKNLHCIIKACCTGINDRVSYTDADGSDHELDADNVVIAAGMKSRFDDAIAFQDAGDRFYMVGDCSALGSVEHAMRSAFRASIVL